MEEGRPRNEAREMGQGQLTEVLRSQGNPCGLYFFFFGGDGKPWKCFRRVDVLQSSVKEQASLAAVNTQWVCRQQGD